MLPKHRGNRFFECVQLSSTKSIYPRSCQSDWAQNGTRGNKCHVHLPLALNYPKLPSPEHYTTMTEEWMADVCHQQLQKYKDVLEFAIKIFYKFLHLILKYLEDLKLIDRSFHCFHFGVHKLAWDFNIDRIPPQHGLFTWVKFLAIFEQRTFEKMFQYNFVKGYMSSCFGHSPRVIYGYKDRRGWKTTTTPSLIKQAIEEGIWGVRPILVNLPYTREHIRKIKEL